MTTPMMVKVDQLNFTIPVGRKFAGRNITMIDAAFDCVQKVLGNVWSPVFGGGSWQVEDGVRQYHTTVVDDQTKVRLSFGNVNSDIYVECGGVACDGVRGLGCFYEIFQQEAVRFSRIDLACDFESDCEVATIIGEGYKPSYKTTSVERSPTGDTTYIGSRKSERMLRVYRYHKPHPRSHLLRCEVELKGKTAKAIAPKITEASVADIGRGALKVFELRHHLIATATATVSKLKSRPYDKAKKGRQRWLLTQVAPALVKAHLEGDIDIDEFVSTYIKPHLK